MTASTHVGGGVAPPAGRPLNRQVSQPVRRRRVLNEGPDERQGLPRWLLWGAVLGVLAGIMLGVYALPPILRHYYGEKHIAADEFYEGGGKLIRVDSLGQASEPLGAAAAGNRREDFFASVVVVTKDAWSPKATDFSVQFEGVHDWVVAKDGTIDGQPLGTIPPGVETKVALHFVVELPAEGFPALKAVALHLSDPRVRFAVAP